MMVVPAVHQSNFETVSQIGDRLEIVHPSGNREILVETMLNKKGEPVTEAAGSGITVKLPMPSADVKNAMLARYL
jgi:putative protease